MGVDEKFFHWILKSRRIKQDRRERERLRNIGAYITAEHEGELSIFASAIWQRAIEVKPMDGSGDFDQKTLFLPKVFCSGSTSEVNHGSALLRVLHEHQVSIGSKNPKEVQFKLESIYPNYKSLLSMVEGHCQSPEEILWPADRPEFKPSSNRNLESFDSDDVNQVAGTEAHLKTLPKGRLKHLDEIKKGNVGDQVFHSFEKIETVEEFKGVNRHAEAENQLLEKSKALEELNLDTVIRSQEASSQTYHVNAIGGFEVGDLGFDSAEGENPLKKYLYDEWDKSKNRYKRGWCTILEQKFSTSRVSISKNATSIDLGDLKNELKKLKKIYLKLRLEKRVQKNLFNGPEIDIDKIVRNFSTQIAKKNCDERVYQSKLKRERDLATFILIDTSLSADSWVRNLRVLDETLYAMTLISKLLSDFKDPFGVASFYSNTRTQCHFNLLKDFSDHWPTFEKNLSEVDAQGYTRMGAPLRHATSLLAKRREHKKLLILLGDGKPTDFDRYEGGYGIADTARAIKEAAQQGVIVHALTFEDTSKTILPRLFGKKNYSILKRRSDVAIALSSILARLTTERCS